MSLFPDQPVLIVDDEANELEVVETVLKLSGISNIVKCLDSREVLPLLSRQNVECILLDIMMPHITGQELLPELSEKYPEIPVIIITGIDEVEMAVDCMKKGASDYMVKPVERSHLVSGVKRLIELNDMKRKYAHLQQQFFSDKLAHPDAFKEIVTNDARMRSIFQYIEVVAKSPEPVLITGETGVGKELIARVIHRLSERRGEFVPVNAAGLDDNMFSDTLFGHEKGAFTDAVQARSGMVHQAAEGTLFLDEIGDLSTPSQVKLLRLVQEYEYYPLGSDIPRHTDARIIFSTNCDLKSLLEAGQFRKDLYHRIGVHRIHVPPLRERFADLPLLVEHFLEEAAKKLAKKKPNVPQQLFSLLKTYHFPGNIRELRAMVMDAASSSTAGMLSLKSFREVIGPTDETIAPADLEKFKTAPDALVTFSHQLPTLDQVEQLLVEEALAKSGGNQTTAAQILGISRQALNNRLQRRKKQ